MNALILEDDDLFAELLETVIAGLRPGIRVTVASGFQEAARLVREQSFNLVVTDWNLPDGSGLDLVKQIRAEDMQLPIVIVSGRADRESVLRAAHYGINGYITKPLDVRLLHKRLSELLADVDEVLPSVEDFLSAALEHVVQLPTEVDAAEIFQLQERQADLSAAQLAERWRELPGLSARLLDVANSTSFRRSGEAVEHLRDAVSSLGVAMALNQALALALDVSGRVQHAELAGLARQYHDKALTLAKAAQSLALKMKKTPVLYQQAGLLSRLGEMAAIKVLDDYLALGGQLQDGQPERLIQQWAQPFGNRLKVQWRLPLGLRELIGAVYVLPSNSTREGSLLMRAAALEAEGQASAEECQRLMRRLGLDDSTQQEVGPL
ncbi:response regulator [Marinobacter fuscus]|uniref:Response regulator n=1 Tax=Marinobacter fuscus TaxID=2109942 RepID=A0A2T1K501_9GAMM|nr:response regulator [Marinobacter fuscus]PSF05108.1 response regulator [Marinobacter fuscus]